MHREQLYSVRRKKTPVNKYYYFRYSSIFFTKFSEIILDTVCYYCCKFYRLIFRCLELAQFCLVQNALAVQRRHAADTVSATTVSTEMARAAVR